MLSAGGSLSRHRRCPLRITEVYGGRTGVNAHPRPSTRDAPLPRFPTPPSSPTRPSTGYLCSALGWTCVSAGNRAFQVSCRGERGNHGAPEPSGDASPQCGGRARAEWSGESGFESAEEGQVVIGRHRCQRGSRHGSAWCDLRRRQFRRARTSRRSSSAAGLRADDHDNDTSGRAGDQRREPDRDRDHAIGLHAGYQAVVAGVDAQAAP